MPELFPNQRSVISTGTIIRFFLVGLLFAALYYVLDLVLVVIASVILASSIEPLIRKLRVWGVHRIIAVILIYLCIALALGALLAFFLPSVANDLALLLRNLPETLSFESLWAPIQSLGFDVGATSIAPHGISVSDLIASLQGFISGSSSSIINTAALVFGGLFGLTLIVVLSFYLAVQEEGVADFLRIVTPVKHQAYITDLWKRSQHKIGAWLQGQILLGLVVGVLVYLVLMIVGIPHALVLAMLAAILEIIPVFGPIIAAVPALFIAIADKGIGTGLLIIGLYVVIHQFESQLFYPLVVKKIVGVSPIVVILALIVGGKLAGILGALIAVPLAAALMEYVSDVDRRKRSEIAKGSQ